MNDPLVKSVKYRLTTHDTVSFDPSPVSNETCDFSFHLEDEVLSVALKPQLASVTEARNLVEPYLRAWEVHAGLKYGRREVTFEFEEAEVVDRNPPTPGDPQAMTAEIAEAVAVGMKATAHITRSRYPGPPSEFRLSPDVQTLWHRYEGYREGREPLFSMAYFCDTVLKARSGGRSKAAKRYNISESVLRTLTEITSTRGDEQTARKFSAQQPATGPERTWVDRVVRALIKQVGIHDAGRRPKKLTMEHLPKL